MLIDDDGPGILYSQRELIFQRGQRADTLRPGQGIWLSVALDIIEQYEGGSLSSPTVSLVEPVLKQFLDASIRILVNYGSFIFLVSATPTLKSSIITY